MHGILVRANAGQLEGTHFCGTARGLDDGFLAAAPRGYRLAVAGLDKVGLVLLLSDCGECGVLWGSGVLLLDCVVDGGGEGEQ